MNAARSLAIAFIAVGLVCLNCLCCFAIDIALTFDTPADQFPAYDPDGSKLQLIALAAADMWEDLLPFGNNAYSVTVHWGTFPANSTQLAVYNGFDHSINVRRNNAWFLDPTPTEHGEFAPFVQTLYRDLDATQQASFNGTPPDLLETGYTAAAVSGGVADGVDDLLSVLLHEMGHFTEIGYNLLAPDVAIQSKFIGGVTGVSAQREDESHITPDNALLDPQLAAGQRVLPSALDLMVAANEQNHSDIRLRRIDWLGNVQLPGPSLWSVASGWEGGRTPTTGTNVTVRDGGNLQVLSAPGTARTLLLTQNSDLTIFDDLHVALDTQIFGSGGFDHPTVVIADATGTMAVDRNLDISLGGVQLNGGQLDVTGLLILDGEVSGAGFVNTSTLNGYGAVNVGSQLRNRGRVKGEGGTLVITAGASGKLDLDGNQEATQVGLLLARDGNLEFHGPLNDAFDGTADIGAGHSIRFDEEWTFGQNGNLHFSDAGALAEFFSSVPASHVTFDGSSITLPQNALARVRAGAITLKSGVDVTVPSGAILGLNGNIEFSGGSYTGAGVLRQNGNANVATNTSIAVSEYDWDGFNLPTPADTQIEANAKFMLNVGSIGGAYSGTVS
ncbi:MAG: hypothetical protein KDA92_20805, partial [Planctomycetales bacterium]|nr:hypothetical protein [Planctomycetales bacterium]